MDMKKLMERFENSRFCYAKPGGQGFVDKSECTCDKKKCPCQALQDADRFHKAFEGIAYEDIPYKRAEILEKVKPEFKDSQWFKDNVIE